MTTYADVECLCGEPHRIKRPRENPCAVEFYCASCDRIIRVEFSDVLESPAEQTPPTDTPTP